MSQAGPPAVGQVSADGQFRWDGAQWTPIPRGEREPTAWTRPMQVLAAAVFAVEAVFSVVTAIVYDNRAAMIQVLKAQNTQLPQGMTIEQLADTSVAIAIGVVVAIAVLELVAATGSLLRWRWMFWAALVLFGLGAIGAVATVTSLRNPSSTNFPVTVLVVNELLALAAGAMFVWMLLAAIKYGPWAMKKPGAAT